MATQLHDTTGGIANVTANGPVILAATRAVIFQTTFVWETAALIPAGRVADLADDYLAILQILAAATPPTAAQLAALPAGLVAAYAGVAVPAGFVYVPPTAPTGFMTNAGVEMCEFFMVADRAASGFFEVTWMAQMNVMDAIMNNPFAAPFTFVPPVNTQLPPQVSLANAYMVIALHLEDVNGERYLVCGAGERMQSKDHQKILVTHGFPVAVAGGAGAGIGNVLGPNPTRAQTTTFLMVNTYHILENCIKQLLTTATVSNPPIAPVSAAMVVDALKVATVRLLVVTGGHASPLYNPANYHCNYNDCVQLTAAQTEYMKTEMMRQFGDFYAGAVRGMSTWSATLVGLFNDILSIGAYFFRVRGHHFLPDFSEAIVRIFSKTTHSVATIGILPSWCALLTCGIHAIYPILLDRAWRDVSAASQNAGALAKRVSCAPAGMAMQVVVSRGIRDILVIFPNMKLPEDFDVVALNAFVAGLISADGVDRWTGSINRRLYGGVACPVVWSEDNLSVVASIVMSVYKKFSPGAKLTESAALKRGAEANPVVGGVIGQMGITVRNDKSIAMIAYGVTPGGVGVLERPRAIAADGTIA